MIFHQPRLINPVDVLKQRDKELTYLDMPKDVAKNLPHKPTNVMSDKDRTQQTAKPTLDKKTLEQLQAMRRAGAPEPPPSCAASLLSRLRNSSSRRLQQPSSRCRRVRNRSSRRWWTRRGRRRR